MEIDVLQNVYFHRCDQGYSRKNVTFIEKSKINVQKAK